ncbi:MAG: response regulator [Microcystis sp. M20BS1]|uniref:response regulator n=1 Tax=unclassified Microcystis TaxID=2643300 RepID=UPI00257F96F3|nr:MULTISPECIES: response regulator [unclassified Microcystis]MCA2625616.1 response regulator [Microcystis sp. M19BS1]MCA2634678.1 response regulator [Microcystis sp. M20BS1]
MSAAIFDNRSMCRAVLKREKEVVLMEDSLAVKEAIKEVIEGEVGWIVKMARNSDEVADLAKNGEAAIYIIDNKIGDNPTEGLTALEKINNINKDIPVAIFSAHPSYKIRAEKINNNLVIYEVKGTSLKENARHIITAFVNRLRQLIDEIQNKIKNSDDEYRNIFIELLEKEKLELERDRQKLISIELPEKEKLELERDRQKLELEQLPAKNTSATLSIPTDIDGNFEAYEKCQSDREWLAKYESKYVAFVGGEQVFPKITDEQELLKLIRENYPKQRRLFTKVTKSGKTRVVKAPSGYSKIKKI